MNVAGFWLLLCALSFGLLGVPAKAQAGGFSWLRSENRNVHEGNERLAAGDAKAALSAYDRAARELPWEGGVHLDRGLALIRSGQLGPARDALRLANQPSAAPDVRADAAYDLGITFYREADGLAGENKHDEAQKLFREAADTFKHALRERPGDHNAAWNYELAKRRIREQEDKQKQEQDQKKQQDQQDQKKDQPQDQNEQDQNKQDQNKQDQSKQDGESKPQTGDQPKSEPKQDQPKPDAQQAQNQQKPQPQQDSAKPDQPQPEPAADKNVRPEVSRALDALEDGEQNLERVRALNRASRERRKPEKDW